MFENNFRTSISQGLANFRQITARDEPRHDKIAKMVAIIYLRPSSMVLVQSCWFVPQ